jgi:hypothetical protein
MNATAHVLEGGFWEQDIIILYYTMQTAIILLLLKLHAWVATYNVMYLTNY